MRLTALLVWWGCAWAGAQVTPDLRGVTWTLVQIAPRGEPISIKPSRLLRPPTLTFVTDRLVMGSTGCNGYAAFVRLDQQGFRVSPVRLKGTSDCPDRALGLETDFLDILETANTARLQGERLLITGAAGRTLTFIHAPPSVRP